MKIFKNTALLGALIAAGCITSVVNAATINKTMGVRPLSKVMSDGATVNYWAYCNSGGIPSLPGPAIEVGVGDTLNLTLQIGGPICSGGGGGGGGGMQEPAPYNGHTIHMHGADVSTAEDGVPETNGNLVNGDTYTFTPSANMAGSMMYHCHVHTVKHLEMGMYGALVVRPKDAAGNFLNQITANTATAYSYVQTYLFSTVDPAYHADTAIGDSTVFADYNPKYFMISGKEGKTTAAPAITLAAAKSKKVALRLVGIHSVNGTFSIKDASGNAQPFTIYTQDARSLPTPQTVTTLEMTPGQRFDIMFTTPSTTGTWYPQMLYKNIRDAGAYQTTYGKVTF